MLTREENLKNERIKYEQAIEYIEKKIENKEFSYLYFPGGFKDSIAVPRNIIRAFHVGRFREMPTLSICFALSPEGKFVMYYKKHNIFMEDESR